MQECPICTGVVGERKSHRPGRCFLDGTTLSPDNWRPRNKRILDAANKFRRQRSQTSLTDGVLVVNTYMLNSQECTIV
jgi:hypothetical protein